MVWLSTLLGSRPNFLKYFICVPQNFFYLPLDLSPPLLLQNTSVSVTPEISEYILPSLFCQLLLQSLHNLHLYSPPPLFAGFLLFVPQGTLDLLSSTQCTHTFFSLPPGWGWVLNIHLPCVLIPKSDSLFNCLPEFPSCSLFLVLFLWTNGRIFSFCVELLPHPPLLTPRPSVRYYIL